MGKRVLSTDIQNNPTVRLADRLNSRFVGEYIRSKSITNSNGKPQQIHELHALEGDALITVKDGNTYKEVEVANREVVVIFGTTAIDAAIAQVKPGEVVEFVFLGEKKIKGGRRFHEYAVAILDDAASGE